QAEDGIRADLVTGVQTCALPISRSSATRSRCAVAHAQHAGKSLRAQIAPAVTSASEDEHRVAEGVEVVPLRDREPVELARFLHEIGRASCRESREIAGWRARRDG